MERDMECARKDKNRRDQSRPDRHLLWTTPPALTDTQKRKESDRRPACAQTLLARGRSAFAHRQIRSFSPGQRD
jgi:hypothetical protein